MLCRFQFEGQQERRDHGQEIIILMKEHLELSKTPEDDLYVSKILLNQNMQNTVDNYC